MTMTQNDTTCWKTQENSSRYYLIFWCVINKINISNYVINKFIVNLVIESLIQERYVIRACSICLFSSLSNLFRSRRKFLTSFSIIFIKEG